MELAPLEPRKFSSPPCFYYTLHEVKCRGIALISKGIRFLPLFVKNIEVVQGLKQRTHTKSMVFSEPKFFLLRKTSRTKNGKERVLESFVFRNAMQFYTLL